MKVAGSQKKEKKKETLARRVLYLMGDVYDK